MSGKQVISYQVDPSTNPATWPGGSQQPTSGFLEISKVDVLFVNVNNESDFKILRTGTNESVQHSLNQAIKHAARVLYRIVNLSASDCSCVAVMSTEKSREDLMWKNGFPWDREGDAQPEVVLE